MTIMSMIVDVFVVSLSYTIKKKLAFARDFISVDKFYLNPF